MHYIVTFASSYKIKLHSKMCVEDQQTKIVNLNKSTKDMPLTTNAPIWYHKLRRAKQLAPKYALPSKTILQGKQLQRNLP